MRQGKRWEALRATIVLWSAQGESARIIAQTLGVTPRTVYNCRRRWRLRGLKGLAPAACRLDGPLGPACAPRGGTASAPARRTARVSPSCGPSWPLVTSPPPSSGLLSVLHFGSFRAPWLGEGQNARHARKDSGHHGRLGGHWRSAGGGAGRTRRQPGAGGAQ
ncbi:helix-turn-helix domain-containing protein [Corallococcus macrosporus]|uniref:helix-turn-helix domain-containing protein n=1 Tax=Corallococcus macrosporus TaxID=35 RepID=UPI003B838AD7